MDIFILIAIIIFGGGIALILKNGFNEMIKAMESIDERLKNIEEKIQKK